MRGSTSWSQLKRKVVETIRRHSLWAPGHRVAVAVSGGRDSMVLLDLLVATRVVHKGILSVVTVDHGCRGEESAGDASFVEAKAQELGLPCVRASLSLGEHASEAVCRDARYAVLDGLDVDRVVLGHHQRDQVETMLLAALRGGGASSLSGMVWTNGRHVRPLLDVTDAELEAWAKGRGVTWREDSSNAEMYYLRNRLRQVMPALLDLRPGSQATLARVAGNVAEDDDYLQDLALASDPGGDLSVEWLVSSPKPLVRRVLHHRWGLTFSQMDALLSACHKGSGKVCLPDNVSLVISQGVVQVVA